MTEPIGTRRHPRVVPWVLVAAALLPAAVHFGPVLCGGRSFAFRDATHFYYPLFHWTGRQWATGRVPLWNPQENGGMPAAGDPTSSLFYPVKLLFALPLEYVTAYKLYIVLHVLLAGFAAYRLARHWRASPSAAALAAISYAFGGNVLFQYSNVIYLVGAAWLPLALLAADFALVARSWRGAVAFGAVLALMVLGGDPQAAYHAGLLAVLYAALLGGWWIRGSLLGLAAVTALILSAIQVLPGAQWTAESERAAFSLPRSIYEIPAASARSSESLTVREIAAGLCGPPPRGTHHEHIYHFSVGPWRFAECLWPNISGRLFPRNHRWTNAIPAEGRVWTPSLYLGLAPLLLGLGAWRLRRGRVADRWLSWALLLAAVGSLGWYGVGWLLREIHCAFTGAGPGEDALGAPLGGLYWLMVTLLPGYAYFRFPAKLLVIAQLACSLLAARGLDRLSRSPAALPLRIPAGIVLLSVLLAAATLAIEPAWSSRLAAAPVDRVYGPVDAAGAMSDVRISLAHACLVGAVLVVLLGATFPGQRWLTVPMPRWQGRVPRRPRSGAQRPVVPGFFSARRPATAVGIVALTAAELALAGRPWMLTVPDAAMRAPSFYEQALGGGNPEGGMAGSSRVFRGAREGWWPDDWASAGSLERPQVNIRWDRDTLAPRYPLAGPIRVVASAPGTRSRDYQAFLDAARSRGPRRPDGVREPARPLLDLMSARFLLLPGDFAYGGTERLEPADARRAPTDAGLWYNPSAFPRAWVVHQVIRREPLASPRDSELQRRTHEVLFAGTDFRPFRQLAVVETDLPLGELELIGSGTTPRAGQPPGSTSDNGECRILAEEPERLEIEAVLTRPGLLVVSDTYSSDWQAELTTNGQPPRAVPILRTNRVLRGVALPAGPSRVVMRYRPRCFYAGAALTAAGWLGAVGLSLSGWIAARAPRR